MHRISVGNYEMGCILNHNKIPFMLVEVKKDIILDKLKKSTMDSLEDRGVNQILFYFLGLKLMLLMINLYSTYEQGRSSSLRAKISSFE